MKEDIKTLQYTVRKLEERIVTLEQARRSKQATRASDCGK